MKNIILCALAITLLPNNYALAQSANAEQDSMANLSDFNSSSIADFETVNVISTEANSPKTEEVQDIAVPIPVVKSGPLARIIPTTTSADTNKEVIPAQESTKLSIDSQAIKRLLREHIPQFRSCYQNALDAADQPDTLKGSINLKFLITVSGKVAKSEITSQDFHSEKVHGCIKNTLEGIQFPEADKSISVNQPMNLNALRK